LITVPVEVEMNGIPRMVVLRSISLYGLSDVRLTFRDGTDNYFARQQVFERIADLNLPNGVTPSVAPLFSPSGLIYRYVLQSPDRSPLELKTIDPLNPVSVAAELSAGKISLTPAQASVLADSPAKVVRRDRGEHVSTVTRSVLEAFGEARGEIRIASPYFIPGQEGLTVLTGAIERGVRIRVMTNGFGATDEPLVHQRYSHYRREMLRAGLDLYELRPDPAHDAANLGNFGSSSARLHAKVAIIDSKTVFIGSMNLDPRSTWSNTEMGLLIESEKLAGQIKSVLRNDRNASLYRLRLANNGESIEWVATDSSGATRVIRDEPDSHWLLRLKTFLLQPFISEDLL